LAVALLALGSSTGAAPKVAYRRRSTLSVNRQVVARHIPVGSASKADNYYGHYDWPDVVTVAGGR
jgi:hypothetical protein